MSDRNRQTHLDGPAVTFWPITNALAGVYYISNSSKRCLIFVQRAGTLARKNVTFTTTTEGRSPLSFNARAEYD
ncbi:hypothetical protein SAMN04490369_107213 [Vreelandella aquamarina]|jgi:hypothetical protein|uniref:Uncharacterized protein n=1 Tax=Vreelandella aquamarina TaxID=77097 RepID=A0A1H8NW38_9GAMM|nr:hypothetical protein SAMN04490369_107213 [Halomonas aquamarina]